MIGRLSYLLSKTYFESVSEYIVMLYCQMMMLMMTMMKTTMAEMTMTIVTTRRMTRRLRVPAATMPTKTTRVGYTNNAYIDASDNSLGIRLLGCDRFYSSSDGMLNCSNFS